MSEHTDDDGDASRDDDRSADEVPGDSGAADGAPGDSGAASEAPGESGATDGAPAGGGSAASREAGDGSLPWVSLEAAVAGVVALALVARLVDLGARTMHFDEGRVAYWALEFTRTGAWEYRYIVHGPLIQHADAWLFGVLGPTNFAARLPVAVVSAALPATALLFRDYLDDDEVFGVAALFALNPLLLYYSRFMRSDLLVATFSVAALGFLARAWTRRAPRYLYPAAAALALAFASKENAVVYWVCWAGMLATVGGLEFVVPRRFEDRTAFVDAVRNRAAAAAGSARGPAGLRWAGHLAGAAVLALLVTVYLYAPRSPGASAGLAAGPLAASAAAFDAILDGFDHWGGTGVPGCLGAGDGFFAKYACNLGRELAVLGDAALATVGLAVLGYAVDQRERPPRVLVAGAGYWGLASVLGYPLGADILFPAWVATHAVVAFVFPAGVGLARVVRWGRDAHADDETVDVALAAVVVVVVAGLVLGNAVHFAFLAPQSGDTRDANVVQYAQPADDLSPVVEEFDAVAAADRTVLVYGDDLVDGEEPGTARHEPACVKWLLPTNPLSWHLYASDADVACAATEAALDERLAATDAPVVVVSARQASVVEERLGDGWERATYRLRLGDSPQKTAVVFVRTGWRADDAGAADRSGQQSIAVDGPGADGGALAAARPA
jgi:uncharacterized protein (TIGR03663 family)